MPSRAQSCSEKYWHFINSCPLLVCIAVSIISITLSISALITHPPTLDANPEEAFKTWRTEISARLFTWREIERDLTNSPQLLLPSVAPPLANTRRKRQRDSEDYLTDEEEWEVLENTIKDNPGIPPSTIGQCVIRTLLPVFEFAMRSAPSSKSEMPVRIAVFEAARDQLPTRNETAFCHTLHKIRDPSYRSVSLCDLIKTCDIRGILPIFERKVCRPGDNIEQLMEVIRHYVERLGPRGVGEGDSVEETLKTVNGTLAELETFNNLVLCAVQKMFLSKQAFQPDAEHYFTAVYFNKTTADGSSLAFYDHIVNFAEEHGLTLKGYFTGEQGIMDIFERCMWSDMKICIPVTLLLVFILMFAYTGSVLYSVVVLMSAGFSFTISYFLYFTVFKEFWFTNYLGAVILLGIGADDCFVLVHNIQQEELRRESSRKVAKKRTDSITTKTSTDRNGNGLERPPTAPGKRYCLGLFQWTPVSPWMLRALKHAAITMFITSATTAAAFLCNIVTPVFGIKAFGFFSGCLVVVNYLMVITLVPASLLVKQRYLDNACGGNYSRFSSLLKGLIDVSDRVQEFAFRNTIPRWINTAKWFLSSTLLLLVCASCFIIFYRPGLSRAQNTTQLFHASHEIQWFQDSMGEDFELTTPANYEDVHVIWGADYADTSAPNDGDEGELQLWKNFRLTEKFMRDQRQLCDAMAGEGYQVGPEGCFAKMCQEEWSSGDGDGLMDCLRAQTMRQKASADPLKRASSGPYWKRPHANLDSSLRLNDVKVYIQSFRKKFASSLQLSRTCDAVAGLKKEVETVFREKMGRVDNATSFREGWVVASSRMAFRRLQSCDLQDTLQKNTAISVSIPIAIALLVVVATTVISQLCVRPKGGPARFIRTVATGFVASFTCICVISCTVATMALMHWKLNTVESVIIALAIGLSFDFTMHYAYAYVKQELTKDTQACLVNVFQIAGIPVLLSFLSTFTAGFCFLFAKAFPLFQVGLFMIVVTGFSWAFATFLFPAAMSTVDVVICATLGEPARWESEPNSPVHLAPMNGAKPTDSSIGDGASIIVRGRLLDVNNESLSQGTGGGDGVSNATLCDAQSRQGYALPEDATSPLLSPQILVRVPTEELDDNHHPEGSPV